MRKSVVVAACCFYLVPAIAFAQTFEINGPNSEQPTRAKKTTSTNSKSVSKNGEIGWGSSIEVGRLARAAEVALAKGNAAAAADFAERALKAAPQNTRLWFLLGYASRLAGRGQRSVEAYQRGLQAEPHSVEGLSGLAQTYMRMGRATEAKNLLLEVIAANPRRPNDLMMAGELFLQSGELQRGADLLARAESMGPNAHAEVLLATAYMRMKQPERAKQLLDRAKARTPKNADVFRAIANYYRDMKYYDAAINTLKQVPGKSPAVLGELAYTYGLAGRNSEAAETYVKAADAAPRDINLQLSAAQALVRLGNTQHVQQFLSRAAVLDENHYRLHAIRAEMARSDKRTDEAIQEYLRAISSLPENAPEGLLYPIQLRMNLSEQYRDAGEETNAEQQLQIAQSQINKLQVEGPIKADFLRLRASLKAASDDLSGAEDDLKQARSLDPANVNISVQYATLLWRMKRSDEARLLYSEVLKQDPANRFALQSLGYLAREKGDNKTAEQFFTRLASIHPDDYVPYLALGDLKTAVREFGAAQENYQKAYKIAPTNPLVVAGGTNASIEAHQIPLAAEWLERAKGRIQDEPRVMKERQRYLFHVGKYLESAQLGYKVVQALPHDRDAIVYLGYDLYNLGRYDDVLALVRDKKKVLPREPNLPLLAGHVQKQGQLLDLAVDDYTQAIKLDPNMVEAYVNRGYVLNDMQNAEQAAADFNHVLKDYPGNGVARLGLAFSYLELHKGKAAHEQVDAAEKILGESGSTHLARATAFRQQRLLANAEKEYRAALRFAPGDLKLNLALADTLYYLRRYGDSLNVLDSALAISPNDPLIYARMAHANAQLRRRDETVRYVEAAEKQDGQDSSVMLATGGALMLLGDSNAALGRFERALEAPDASRVDARLAIGKLFVRDGRWDDARQQIALGFAESRVGEAAPVTTDNLIDAANLFLSMRDFDLAKRYFQRAKNAGAADQVIAIGLANTYLAQGYTEDAEAQLSGLGSISEHESDYDYTLAMANVYRQRRENVRALSLYARANMLAGEDDAAESALRDLAGEEGLRVNQRVSLLSDMTVAPIFEDSTIYMMDARFLGAGGNPSLALPPPRSSIETRWTTVYRIHQGELPTISGFFQLRNSQGSISLPSEFRIINRNTYDYTLNGALNPVLRIGRNWLAFNTGLQGTFRRDHESATEMNQNLFRQFMYLTTNSFGNWLSVRGSLLHEAGPFTLRELSSRDVVGSIEFTVGRPWGTTALITGYSARDLQFRGASPFREFFTTSTYVGLQHQFGNRLKLTGLGEYIRSWRVQANDFVTAQIMRPAVELEYKPSKRWTVNGTMAFSRGQGFHAYDNVQSGLLISYVKSLRRNMDDGAGNVVPIEYPLRFSVGIQQEEFFNFTGRSQALLRPVVRLTLF